MNAHGFVQAVAKAAQTGDDQAIARLFDAGREQLVGSDFGSDAALLKTCSKQFPGQEAFALFLAKYLEFLRDAQALSDSAGDVQEAYKSFRGVFIQARQVFTRHNYAWFVPILRKITNSFVELAFQVDEKTHDWASNAAGSAAGALNPTLSVAASASGDDARQGATLFLANSILRIYFHLNNPRMGNTVTKSTGAASDRIKSFPKGDQTAFLYYTGRMLLVERHLRPAAAKLKQSFNTCSQKAWKNQRIILIYLITASLPLGTFPSIKLLQKFNLAAVYGNLIIALKTGNAVRVFRELDAWQQWHMKHGTYLLLREKLEVLCWRNLIRKTLYVTDKPQPGARVVIRLDLLVSAAQFAFQDATIDRDDVECMCVSLIDQGYLKAYVHNSTGQLVLQKGGHFGFPPIASVGRTNAD